MNIAVIADIHSNYPALENAMTMLSESKPDALIFLGDYVSDCPRPEKTMKLIYEAKSIFNCYFVRGNREDYLIERRHGGHPEWSYSSSTGSLLYTYEHLSESDLDFFETMPASLDISFDGYPIITACHGSPDRTKEWIKDDPVKIERYFRKINGSLLLCGHTHGTGVYNAFGKKAIFCPSIGLGQDKTNPFGMTYLKTENGAWKFQMVKVPFDMDFLIRDFYDSGLIENGLIWSKSVIKTLEMREDFAFRTVSLAWELSKKDGYTGGIPLPEKYWLKAAELLGI